MPPPDASNKFWPLTWSPDGSRLAGLLVRPDGLLDGLAQFELATHRYARILETAGSRWLIPLWLADSRRLLVRDRNGIFLLDAGTGRIRRLVEVSGYFTGFSLGVTRENHWITYTETATDGDIWLMTLE